MPDPELRQIVPPPRDLSSVSAGQIGSEAGPLLEELLKRAGDAEGEGSMAAAETLLALLTNAVTDFEKICTDAPERFRAWAREREGWPMLQHKHPGLKRRTLELVQHLELGRGTELNYIHKSFNPETPANQVVLDLYYAVKFYRMSGKAPPQFVAFGEAVSDEAILRLDTWCRDVAPSLPRLSRETWKEWDQKTRFLFHLHQGNEFQDHPHFAPLVQHVRETDGNGNPSRSHRRAAILRAVSDAWKSISAFPPEG